MKVDQIHNKDSDNHFDGHHGKFACSQEYLNLTQSERDSYWKMNQTKRAEFRKLHKNDIHDIPSIPSQDHGMYQNKIDPSSTTRNGSNADSALNGINLSKFGKLQLPSGTPGHPDTIQGEKIARYSSPYFKNNNGVITFIVPPGGGVTTANSKYPRSELKEDSTWKMSAGTAKLEATVSIDKLPSNGNIVIGQIHQDNGSINRPPIELHYNNGRIVAGVMDKQTTQSGSSRTNYTIASGFSVGDKFSYSMEMSPSGKVEISVNGKSTPIQLDPSFNNSNFYFKAGNYVQDTTGNSAVSFYSLDISHT
jgi:hypothetical protein